jgi:predicted O-linked N-acetylglucosamine transferase (SPINDLY family)
VFDPDLPEPASRTRREYGLPEKGLVLCNFDLPFKIGPEVFSVWMRLLERVAGAVLWLLDCGEAAQANLRREARARGVSDERLRFAPAGAYGTHFACLRHVDLFLDTFFYGARSMVFDALWRGVPVLTCAGKTMPARLSIGFLKSLGLDELVTETHDAYERKALELASDPASLDRVKQALAAARAGSPAFDVTSRIRAVERAFVAVVERHRAGLPPDTLVIN